MNATIEPLRPKRKCPECGKESKRETYPFCSQRCKDIDLNRWLSGKLCNSGDGSRGQSRRRVEARAGRCNPRLNRVDAASFAVRRGKSEKSCDCKAFCAAT
jgi:endogenous inhibitor of DNA gyrase (YacG/DUF329 family)